MFPHKTLVPVFLEETEPIAQKTKRSRRPAPPPPPMHWGSIVSRVKWDTVVNMIRWKAEMSNLDGILQTMAVQTNRV